MSGNSTRTLSRLSWILFNQRAWISWLELTPSFNTGLNCYVRRMRQMRSSFTSRAVAIVRPLSSIQWSLLFILIIGFGVIIAVCGFVVTKSRMICHRVVNDFSKNTNVIAFHSTFVYWRVIRVPVMSSESIMRNLRDYKRNFTTSHDTSSVGERMWDAPIDCRQLSQPRVIDDILPTQWALPSSRCFSTLGFVIIAVTTT